MFTGRRVGRAAVASIAVSAGVALIAAASLSLVAAVRPVGAPADFGSVALQAPTRTAPSVAIHPRRPRRAVPVTQVTAPPGVPLRLNLAALQIHAPIEAVSSEGGELSVPHDPGRLGWWAGGALPGTARGSVVIDGHVDSAATGPGALYRLIDLRPGDTAQLDTATGRSVTYRVVSRRSYAKTSGLPAGLLSRTGPAQLLLITCGGAFDRRALSYEDNVVVIARPVLAASSS